MSWFGRKGGHDKNRKKQITSLEARDGKSYKLYKLNKNKFRVSFAVRGFPEQLSVFIQLQDDFPQSKPILKMDSKYSHEILDNSGQVTGLRDLNNWSVHSDLGLVVQELVNKFGVSAPSIKSNHPSQNPQMQLGGGLPPSYDQHVSRAQSQPHPNAYGNGGGYNGANHQIGQSISLYGQPLNQNNNNHMNNNNNNNSKQQQFDLSHDQISPPSILPHFDEKTDEEFGEMLKEPKLIEDWAYEIASVLREMKSGYQDGAMRTADSNLKSKEEIDKLVKDNDKIRSNIETQTEVYKSLKKRQDKVLQKFSAPKITQAFDDALDKIDEESTELKDKFEEGDMAPITFAKKLTKLRTHYHTLSIKKEKFTIMFGHQYM